MPYSESFKKMEGSKNPVFSSEVPAVQDGVTEQIGAPTESAPGVFEAKNDLNAIIQALLDNDVAIKAIADALGKDLVSHKGDKANPHSVTKEQVGLGNVPNFPASSATNSDSESTLATSKAVSKTFSAGESSWGGNYRGNIQDPIPKILGNNYTDIHTGRSFRCIKAGDSTVVDNTSTYFEECNTASNLEKLQNLYNVRDFNIIDLDSKTLLVSANVSVKNGQLNDFSQIYGLCQKYLAFSISNIIPIPKSVHLLGCFCGVKDKTQFGWIAGTSATVGYNDGVFHLYLTNPTAQYSWADQSVSFSFIAKY